MCHYDYIVDVARGFTASVVTSIRDFEKFRLKGIAINKYVQSIFMLLLINTGELSA